MWASVGSLRFSRWESLWVHLLKHCLRCGEPGEAVYCKVWYCMIWYCMMLPSIALGTSGKTLVAQQEQEKVGVQKQLSTNTRNTVQYQYGIVHKHQLWEEKNINSTCPATRVAQCLLWNKLWKLYHKRLLWRLSFMLHAMIFRKHKLFKTFCS